MFRSFSPGTLFVSTLVTLLILFSVSSPWWARHPVGIVLASQVAFGLLAWIPRWSRESVAWPTFRRLTLRTTAGSLGLGVALQLVGAALAAVLGMSHAKSGAPPWTLVLLTVTVVPFAQEALFRGTLPALIEHTVASWPLWDAMAPEYLARWIGWVATSVAFGAIHGAAGWLIGPIGFLWLLWSRRTQSLTTAALSHAAFNALALILLLG